MEYSCRRCGIDTGGFVGHTCNVITYPAHHTSPEKEYGQPEHKGNGDTIGSLKKLAEVMQEEVSQEKEPSYIVQVVEEFRNSFANAGGDYDGPLTPLETFLREKLKTNIEREVRIAYDCAVYVLPSGEILINPKEAAYEAGKTTERQRIREIVEEERIEGARLFDIGSEFACPRDYRREGNNALIDRLLSRLDEE